MGALQMTVPTHSLFAFGLGYSARVLTARLLREGWHVAGTVRSADKAETLGREGIDARVFDGQGAIVPPAGAHWLISIPPGERGCPAFAAAGVHAGETASVTYLSTTGVYGDLKGGWAFEWSPVNPMSARGRRRVLAEAQWQGSGAPVRIVRLPGIYGPGRSPFDRLRGGTIQSIVKPGQVFSRIHVDDIAGGLHAMLSQPDTAGVFNLTDDAPAPPQVVTAHAARLLGLEPPPDVPFEAAALSDMARSFYAENKRVSNARAKAALGWRPLYPTYREGLAAILATETGQP